MDNQTNLPGEESGFSLEEGMDMVLRRKWLIIIPFILSLIITFVVYTKLPKIYRSNTLILVLPQVVPRDYVRPTITAPIEARLANITDEILSRTRLEMIINEFNLYPEERKKETIEQIVSKMRGNISLEINRPRRRGMTSSFEIFYQGKNPEIVMKVTNKLASLFIEENLKAREQQARITTDFLKKELDSTKQKLEDLESAITQFKFQNIGNLPEQSEANLRMLDQLAGRRQMINDSIARAENKELLLYQQLSGIHQFLDEGRGKDGIPLINQLAAAKNKLLVLKSTYTENHIEVKKVQELIKQLNEQLMSFEEGTKEETPEIPQIINPEARNIKTQLIIQQKEIELLKKEKARIERKIAIYEKRMERIPQVELQLTSLTRDYENTNRFYKKLLREKTEAEQAETLEKRQQGEQFRILDPASLPRIPFKPNPKKIFTAGILFGVFAGGCLIFLAEKMDRSIKSVKEAEKYFGIPILAAVPLKEKQKA